MAEVLTNPAEMYAELLNDKFNLDPKPDELVGSLRQYGTDHLFTVHKGHKYDKLIRRNSVHCFVERATGHIYKAAGVNQRAKGVRYYNIFEAAEKADLYGYYLYLK